MSKANLKEHIRHQILTLAWAPGQDLDESSLSEQFGVSRTPLREVFRELAGLGFLELRLHRNTRVAELSHQTLREFFQAAPMLYRAVLELAAQNRTSTQLDSLIAIQARLLEAIPGQLSLLNHEFHHLTAQMADNRYLLPSFERLLIDHTRIGQTFFEQPDLPAAALNHHDQMIQAITDRDAQRAGELAIEHWNLSRTQFAQFVMPSGLDAPLGEWLEGEKHAL